MERQSSEARKHCFRDHIHSLSSILLGLLRETFADEKGFWNSKNDVRNGSLSNKSTKKNKSSKDFVLFPRAGSEICFCKDACESFFRIICGSVTEGKEETLEDGEGWSGAFIFGSVFRAHLQSRKNRWAFDFVIIPHLVPIIPGDTLEEDCGKFIDLRVKSCFQIWILLLTSKRFQTSLFLLAKWEDIDTHYMRLQ